MQENFYLKGKSVSSIWNSFKTSKLFIMLNYSHQEHKAKWFSQPDQIPIIFTPVVATYQVQLRVNHFPPDTINSPKDKTAWTSIFHYHVFTARPVHLQAALDMSPCLKLDKTFWWRSPRHHFGHKHVHSKQCLFAHFGPQGRAAVQLLFVNDMQCKEQNVSPG